MENFGKIYIKYPCPNVSIEKARKMSISQSIIVKSVKRFNPCYDSIIARELFKLYEGNVKVVLIDETEFMNFVKVMLPKYLKMKEDK